MTTVVYWLQPFLLQLPSSATGLWMRRKELRAVKQGKVAVVDGHQMFNRPGPRLVDGLEWLVGLLHDQPGTIPQGFPWVMLHELTVPAELSTANGGLLADRRQIPAALTCPDTCICTGSMPSSCPASVLLQ